MFECLMRQAKMQNVQNKDFIKKLRELRKRPSVIKDQYVIGDYRQRFGDGKIDETDIELTVDEVKP